MVISFFFFNSELIKLVFLQVLVKIFILFFLNLSLSGSAVPRYHEASSSSRNDIPFSYPSPNFFSHHLPRPPPTVYPPRMASASYTVPVTIHDASYRNGGPVQPTGLRINQQHPRDDFSPAATLRHRGLPHLRVFHAHVISSFTTIFSSSCVGLFKSVCSSILSFFC